MLPFDLLSFVGGMAAGVLLVALILCWGNMEPVIDEDPCGVVDLPADYSQDFIPPRRRGDRRAPPENSHGT